jgi:hypothetical protein
MGADVSTDYIDGIIDVQTMPVDTKALCTMANQAPREAGVHLSSILKALDEALHGKKYQDDGGWDLELCATIGFTWERVLELALGDLLGFRPESIEKDGIHMSPDYIGSDPLGEVPLAVVELKCWWRSPKRTPMHGWYEVHQNMSYCYALGTNVGLFHTAYLVGAQWRDGPKWCSWRVKYSDEALEANWGMVVRNKEMGIQEEGHNAPD